MRTDDDLVPSPDESLDTLAGDWKLFQLKRGHRFSSDDMATAWRAAENAPVASRLLDIGCGIGSVGLLTLWRLNAIAPRERTLLGVEAQEVSVGLARRTVRYNGLQDRVRIIHGDLRDPEVLPAGSSFDLITGSPPYIPPGKGLLSPVPQRAGARIELRGSIYDYCAAARRWLAPGGRFCFVMAAADPRTEDAPKQHGFSVLERWDYVFGRQREPHIATLLCARVEDVGEVERRTGRLDIRGSDGNWTDAYLRFRKDMGLAAPLDRG